jgi:transcriptional regulator with XRE-family HTH domain
MSIDAGRRALNDQVAEEIRVQLARKRMSQAELARRLAVSGPWLSYRLTGKQPIDLNDLDAIATALGVTPRELLVPVKTRSTEQYVSHRPERQVSRARKGTPARSDDATRPPNRPAGPHRPVLIRGSSNG